MNNHFTPADVLFVQDRLIELVAESQKQTAAQERIAVALERIAGVWAPASPPPHAPKFGGTVIVPLSGNGTAPVAAAPTLVSVERFRQPDITWQMKGCVVSLCPENARWKQTYSSGAVLYFCHQHADSTPAIGCGEALANGSRCGVEEQPGKPFLCAGCLWEKHAAEDAVTDAHRCKGRPCGDPILGSLAVLPWYGGVVDRGCVFCSSVCRDNWVVAEGIKALAAHMRNEHEARRTPAPRKCTCLGSCKGPNGLAPGWVCALGIRPTCAACTNLATCYGSYEGAAAAYACDDCCGHGCEDGKCERLEPTR